MKKGNSKEKVKLLKTYMDMPRNRLKEYIEKYYIKFLRNYCEENVGVFFESMDSLFSGSRLFSFVSKKVAQETKKL